MEMEFVLSAICVFIIAWGLPKLQFFKGSGLSAKELRLLLGFKLMAGLAFAVYFKYVFENISVNVDYIGYNTKGLEQYQLLLKSPRLFFTDFSNDIDEYGLGGILSSKDSFWAYIRFNILYKFIALLNLVTRGNFYLNTILFSSIVFTGHIAFFRVYHAIYKAHKWKILLACFCLPSILLYTACIHKDGLIFVGVGVVSYIFSRLIQDGSLKGKYGLAGLTALLFIFLLRNYVVFALVPALLVSLLSIKLPFAKRYIVVPTYMLFLAMFFVSGLGKFPVNLPAAVVQRKADFATLEKGNTTIPMNELEPTFQGFVQNLPQAINHALLRPYIWEFRQTSVMLTALELLLYQLIFAMFVIYRKKNTGTIHPFNIFGLALGFNMLLIIGYTIPNIGAIVRYRSIFWIFLVCPLLGNIDWKRLSRKA